MGTSLEALLERTLVFVAHPDDEAIACGVLLQRIAEPLVAFATDGGPHEPWFWRNFSSREAYAEARHREACEALRVADIHEIHSLDIKGTNIPDQGLFRSLPPAYGSLCRLIERLRPKALVTHAYEGGHPDHDCCSFLARQLTRKHAVLVWEFPLYHRSAAGVVYQEYLPSQGGNTEDFVLKPSTDERARKQRMLEAYRSQAEVLRNFTSDVERFRPQPEYDYSRPPHSGTLCYEDWQWAMTGAQVNQAFIAFGLPK